MSLKANLFRAWIIAIPILATAFLTESWRISFIIALAIFMFAVLFIVGTMVGLWIDEKDSKKRRHGSMGPVR